MESNEWSIEPNICGTCPVAAKQPVSVPYALYRAWVDLAKAMDRTEWIAYLLGDAATYTVTDYYFPEQVATGMHCAPTERAERRPGIIGTVHSHHTMGAFFSGQPDGGGDRGHFNWPVEMVVASDGGIKANIRQPLACGQHHRVDVEVELTDVPAYLTGETIAALKSALAEGEMEEKRKQAEARKQQPSLREGIGSYFGGAELGRWNGQGQDYIERGLGVKANSKGNTTGELIQVPLFAKPEGSELVKVGNGEAYWYCWNCDDVYMAPSTQQNEVCPECREQLMPDEDYEQAEPRDIAQINTARAKA